MSIDPYCCNTRIDPKNIKRLLKNRKQRDKYERLTIERYLEKSSNIVYCPTPGCKYCIEMIYKKDFWCPLCKISTSLSRSDNISAEEIKVISKISRKKFTRCPNCGQGIEKNKGCQHMKCITCGTDFCMKCSRKMSSRNEICICNLLANKKIKNIIK